MELINLLVGLNKGEVKTMGSAFECYLEREQLIEELLIAERESDRRGKNKIKKRIKELDVLIDIFEREMG